VSSPLAPIPPSRNAPRAGWEPHRTKALMMSLIAGGYFAPVLLLLGFKLDLSVGGMVLLVAGGEVSVVGAVALVSSYLADRAGDAASAIYAPRGDTTPYQRTFSYQHAMVMRGDVLGAIRSFEALVSEQPEDVAVHLAAADLLARTPGFAERAATLYREARLLPAATRTTELVSTNALIDLYCGPLADDGKMRSELRRLADRFAGTPPGELARETLARTPPAPSRATP